jgi:hypothetical protein
MGRSAQSAWIIRIFLALCVALCPWAARAAATAQAVALNPASSCSAASLDLTLTTSGATREFYRATNASGTTLAQAENATSLGTTSGTFNDFHIPFTVAQPPNTLIGAYAYVGETPPNASNTAEFFVYYNCSSREVRLSCVGPYGTCPQTAQQAELQSAQAIPAVDPRALPWMALIIGVAGLIALRRRV